MSNPERVTYTNVPVSTDDVIVFNNGSHGAGVPHNRQIDDNTAAGINARRSGSASVLTKNEKGEVKVERKNTDLINKHLSQSS